MSALRPALLPPSQYGQTDRIFTAARGVHLTMIDGREVLCGTSGLWNVNLGYGNEVIADEISTALRDASYLGAFRFESDRARAAADALVDVAGPGHYVGVDFTTSGGSANDLVMKLARQFHALRGEPQRRLVVGVRGGYHGLTFGSFALTSDNLDQRMYGVDQSLIRHVPVNDVAALHKLLERSGHQVAAIVVEPLLGSGAIPLTADYVAALADLRDRHGFLLVADEVATGFGRLGEMFASQSWPSAPDMLVTSKGLTNGTLPAAAVLHSTRVADPFAAADSVLAHGETQAGTAVTAAAVLATIGEFDRLDALSRADEVSTWLDDAITQLSADHPSVVGSAGTGCFRALHIRGSNGAPATPTEVSALVDEIRAAGAVVHPGPAGIQLVPALTYSHADFIALIDSVRAGLERFSARALAEVAS